MSDPFVMNLHAAEAQKDLASGRWRPQEPRPSQSAIGLRNDLIDRVSRAATEAIAAVERLRTEPLLDGLRVNMDEAGHHLEAVVALCRKAREPEDEDEPGEVDTEIYTEPGRVA